MVHINFPYLITHFYDIFTALNDTSYVWNKYPPVFTSGGAADAALPYLREGTKNENIVLVPVGATGDDD